VSKQRRHLDMLRAISFVALSLVFGARSTIAVPTKSVLVLYSNNRLVPGNVAVDHGLSDALLSDGGRSVRTYSEFLDRPEFGGDAYENLVVAYLHGKYATSPPDAIVTVSNEALSFVVRHRAQLFPSAPIVYAVASTATLRSLSSMPPDLIGVPNDYDFSGTIGQALRWQPTARRLVLVTGASPRDHEMETRLRREIPAVAGNLQTEYWTGLPLAVLQSRLATLQSDAVVFTPGFWQDGDGKAFNPRDAAGLIARASSAPVYGPFDTFIGTGIVGGRMPSFEGMGRQAGETVRAILAGAAPATLRLPNATPMTLHIDWRQAQRWGIDEKMIPAGTVIHYKQPTFWEMYRTGTVIALAAFFLPTALIATLVLERRRRSAAELTTHRLNAQLAHASRLAVAGELTAAIAHEINQPLGAVQTSADAADLILQSAVERHADLIRIVTRIRSDTMRASDVIRRLRNLLAKQTPERRPFEAGAAMTDVAMMLRPEAERRKITLETRPALAALHIEGDQIQIQQVLINLVLNAMDAVADLSESRRHVEISMEDRACNVLMIVRDRGQGIALENLPKLFESFFTTKQRGMGIGLSIARSIVETHGGRIWAQNCEASGAAFFVELPALTGPAVSLSGALCSILP
jgi:signal transduction histidine kinase